MALVYTIDKNEFYKLIKQRIISSHPDLLQLLTSKKFKESLIFLKGFNSCLTVMAESPVNESEVKDLLVKEAVKFILAPDEKG